VPINVKLRGFEPAAEGTLYTIRDPDPVGDAQAAEPLTTEEKTVPVGQTFTYEVPACSVTLLRVMGGSSR